MVTLAIRAKIGNVTSRIEIECLVKNAIQFEMNKLLT